MKRRLVIATTLVLALTACATNDTAYRHGDGNYRGPYNDGYYVAADNGYGDYYYDRPIVVGDYFDYGYSCARFGYGYGYGFGGPAWGFGWRGAYDPWFYGSCAYGPGWYGYGGYPWFWYRPWPRHHHPDGDHDADDPPAGWASFVHARGLHWQPVGTPRYRFGMGNERFMRAPMMDRSRRGEWDAGHRESFDRRPRLRDESHR